MTVDNYRDRRRAHLRAVRLATDFSWQDGVERRARRAAGPAAWRRLKAEAAPGACRTFERLARQVEGIDAEREVLEVLRGSRDGHFPAARQVALAVGGKLAMHQVGSGQVAFSLRVLGIFICVRLARVDRCPCWRRMLRECGIERAREKLKAGLPTVLAS